MKVALVHDYIKEYGGAERVLEALHEIWPDASIFTTVYLPQFLGPHKERFEKWDIRPSFLQNIPFKAKLISPFRLIAPFVFRSFDLSQFDVVIVSATGAYSPNTIRLKSTRFAGRRATQNSKVDQRLTTNGRRPIQICYSHTPPRYLYGFATAREWKKNLFFKILGEIANHFLRLVDFQSAQNVDFFIANSKNVAQRIEKFYRRDCVVIYPPIEISNSKLQVTSKLKNTKSKAQYFLAGGRIARPKHIDLIIKTFEKLDLPLKVFGRSFAGENLQSKSLMIKFLGEVSDEKKLELMKNAKAFVFAAEDEDFGITPVEAMSVGTPVIAYKSGGVLESVLEGKTGIFFNELSVGSISKAIKRFNDLNHLSEDECIKQARQFGKERFEREIEEFVQNRIE